MPFTPLHLGPGLAIKALVRRRFSLLSYGIAQIAMDVEPLVGMLRGADVLHGPTHTWLAAPVLGGAVAAIAPGICRPLLRRWNRELSSHGFARFAIPECIEPGAAAIGAFAGTASHVLLDSFVHSDMTPLAPWSNGNALIGFFSAGALARACLLSGLLGAAVWLAIGWIKRKESRHGDGD